MKNLTKFALFAALCGVFAGCGGDSGSNSNGSELPASIKNFSDIADYDCNDARQCAKLYVEEYSDTMQCVNGEWETLISSMKNSCSDSSVILDPDRGSSSSSKDESSSSSKKLSSSSSDESGEAQEDKSSSSIESSSSSSGIDPSTVVKGTMTDERDGKTYKTVTIGEQTWIAENLNFAYNVPTAELDSSSFCYNNEPDSCAKYGRLYLWSAAMDSAAVFSDDGKGCGYLKICSAYGVVRGVCPEGWHLPSLDEWEILFTAVGGKDVAGNSLRTTEGWSSINGSDFYGFSVLPAGERFNDGFSSVRYNAYFWNSWEDPRHSSYAYILDFFYYHASVDELLGNKYNAYSVRCIRNSVGEESEISSSSSSSVEYGSLTDARDGKIYNTVTIGEQTWMAENLNYAYNEKTSSKDSSSFCYGNKPDSCAKYGRLYLWSAAMDSTAVFSDDGKDCGYYENCSASGTIHGICPEGWHLPSDDEWETLLNAVGGKFSAALMLKSTSGWEDGGGGEDSFGFSVLPAGGRTSNDWFDGVGYIADFWSSTEDDSSYAKVWNFDYRYADVYRVGADKGSARSVRCVKDSD